MTRKPYAPGKMAKKKKFFSEYGLQLKEKQRLKFSYGLRERQFVNYVKKALAKAKSGADVGSALTKLLESRLDNVVFKAGFAKSRSGARQLINHGHICVNNRKVDIPSRQIKKGDKVSIRKESQGKKIFTDLDIWLKKYQPPPWLKLDKAKRSSEVIKEPSAEEAETSVNLNLIIEFYSR
jgi:small subunit ribosomal protein S4